MDTIAAQGISRKVLRYSKWDAILIGLSLLHPAAIFLSPSIPVVALGLWWNSNTISHNFIHLPFFRSSRWNRAYSIFLSLLLGFPQSMWRDRHLAHHSGHEINLRFTPGVVAELVAVLAFWAFLLFTIPGFFLFVYLPGYALGLSLCYLHGYFEHSGGATSHYGFVYNVTFFNDGYHVEHHRLPGEHWTRLPESVRPGARTSSWPAIFRWIERVNLELLEKIALRSGLIQRFLLKTHERTLRQLLPALRDIRHVTIVGGGMFPRTAILLHGLLPGAKLTLVDASAANLETAKVFLAEYGEGTAYDVRLFDPSIQEAADLVVIPLSFIGDRNAVYRNPPARNVLVHDWIWARHAMGANVSVFLLKRINLISRAG